MVHIQQVGTVKLLGVFLTSNITGSEQIEFTLTAITQNYIISVQDTENI